MTQLRKLTLEQAEAIKKYAKSKGYRELEIRPDRSGTCTLHYHKPEIAKHKRLEEEEICKIINDVGIQLKKISKAKKVKYVLKEGPAKVPYVPDVVWYASEDDMAHKIPYAIFEVEWGKPDKRKLLSSMSFADKAGPKYFIWICSLGEVNHTFRPAKEVFESKYKKSNMRIDIIGTLWSENGLRELSSKLGTMFSLG